MMKLRLLLKIDWVKPTDCSPFQRDSGEGQLPPGSFQIQKSMFQFIHFPIENGIKIVLRRYIDVS